MKEALKLALEALEEIALAGMSPSPEMIDSKEAFHARQAWRFIGIAARALEPIKEALAQQSNEQVEPVAFGSVTVRRLSQRLENHYDQYQFYPLGESPYLDNVDECYTVYTHPPVPKDEQVKPDWNDEQLKMLSFLDGSGCFDGAWFGERHSTEKGLFWWRKHLKRLFAHPPVPTAQPRDCTRSHPHEEMSKECELRTEIARLTSQQAHRSQAQLQLKMTALEKAWFHGYENDIESAMHNLREEIIKEALAQPEQEPVAYLCENAVGHKYFRWKKPSSTYKPIALYTTPPQRTWVGLTEQEAAECWSTSTVRTWQAIEAKLKEKNT